MATHVGDIFFDAKIDRSQYDKDLSALGKTANKVTGGLGKKLAMAFSVAGIGKFIKDATSAGASLNAMGTIIDASLPNMTKQVDEFAKSAGNMFGLSETQAKGFVGKFASMASAMGYTEEQAYRMSTALTGLAGDVASYYHISADDAYAKLGAVFTGETEALKQLGVVMTQNALDAFALQQGYGAVTSQMSELEKTTLRYNFVMDRLKLASGDFAKYAYTWSGSIATIKLNWANFMATIGQGMINILLPLLQLIARISQALTALGSRFVAWTKRITGVKSAIGSAFGKKTQKDLKTANTGIGDVGKGLGGAGKSAKGAKKAVKELKRELLGFDKITKLTGEKGTTSGGGTGGGGGIGGGGLGDFDLGDYSDDLGALGSAMDYLSNIQLPESLVNALNHLKEAFSGFFSTLKDLGVWVLENVLKPLGNWLLERGLPVQIEALANAIDFVNSALRLIGSILEPLWEPLIKPFLTFLLNYQASQIEKLGNVFKVFAQVLTDAKAGWEKIKSTSGTFTAELKDKFSEAWNKVKGAWNDVKSRTATITTTLSDKFSGAWDKIKKAWNGLKSKSATLSINIQTAVSKAYRNARNKMLKSKIPAVKAFAQKLPALAQGGYVKANTPQLAMIGDNKREGEIVAPESKLKAMAQEVAGAGNTQMITLLTQILTAINSLDTGVYLDGEAIKNNTVRRINQHTRATGQLELII